MRRIALLALLAACTASVHGGLFMARLDSSPPSNTGGGAVLRVNLLTRGWSLTGEISNLVFSATSAGILGPAQPGRGAPPWIPLGHNVEPEGPLTGNGVFTEEELDWLQQGLLSIRVMTDTTRYPEGEIRGPLVAVPEPGSIALVAAASLGVYAGCRRRTRGATSGSSSGPTTGSSSS